MRPVIKFYFQKYRLSALLITNLDNVRYLTVFTGTNGLVLLTKQQSFFLTDFRYFAQAEKEVKNFTIVRLKRDPLTELAELVRKTKIKRLGFEAGAVNYAQYARLKKILSGTQLVPIADDPAKLREIKTAEEIKKIERALKINRLAFEEIRPRIKPGKTEIEIARSLEMALLKHGAEKIGFDTIVASGRRGARPHGVASDKKIKAGELITIDFGGVYRGYHADETVTMLVDERKVSSRQQEIFRVVRQAQRLAIASAKPGAKCSDLDKTARDYISSQGYGQYFGHSLGHGVGLEVHERPILSPASNDVLAEGMTFTIEPGIYLPEWGGVRIEDVFVCTDAEARQISKIDKRLS